MERARAIAALRAAVASDLAALARVTADARSEATGDESSAEGKYDTRATEASYLAAGQGRRLLGLRRLAAWLEQVDPARGPETVREGSLVRLREATGQLRHVVLAPMGGARAHVGDVVVSLVSGGSPLGEQLEGVEPGDVFELDSPRGTVEVVVEHTG